MSMLVAAIDNHTPKQFGENAHVEYGWSNSIQEKILQFSFQLTRTNADGIYKLKRMLRGIFLNIKAKYDLSCENDECKYYFSILYKMIGHTRDIIDGKGEYALTYMIIHTWYDFFPELALFALNCLVDLGDMSHPYGSWKDIKYFCEYCKKQGISVDHPLINHSIMLLTKQLRKDYVNLISNSDDISLNAKWIPREKSSFGWLYEPLAIHYFPEYVTTARTDVAVKKAVLKCKTEFRKIISALNKKIDTLQIKQCDKKWASIDFNNVTSISLSKQKKAFLNINGYGEKRHPDDKDRVLCADNFNLHIQKSISGEIEMKGKRIGMEDFTKQALDLIKTKNWFQIQSTDIKSQMDLLNSQWRDNSTQTGSLENFIAMVDVSGSMEGDPKNAAIALGIRVAEKSKLGKRVMTFENRPKWINLEPYNDFVSMTEAISTDSGLNTNFYAALDLILDSIIVSNLPPEEVEDMVLAIFSDMQLDQADKTNNQTVMYESIRTKYADTGIRLHGKPFKPPHILLWNLRSTDGFPCMSNQQNAYMMSGFSPALLNLFCDQGMDAFKSCTPWSVLIKSLENNRYKIMEQKLREHFIREEF